MQYQRKIVMMTAKGQFDTSLSVNMKSIVLPDFVNGRIVDLLTDAQVFDSQHYQYNIIFGKDFMQMAMFFFFFSFFLLKLTLMNGLVHG